MTALELMLYVTEPRAKIYYHKDTKKFEFTPVSSVEPKHIDWNAKISERSINNVPFLTFKEIDHKEIMSFLCTNVWMTRKKEKNCSIRLGGMSTWNRLFPC